MTTRVTVYPRPYTITFLGTRSTYLITSEEAQEILDRDPILKATRNRVTVQGLDQRVEIRAATLGGGPAFFVESSDD